MDSGESKREGRSEIPQSLLSRLETTLFIGDHNFPDIVQAAVADLASQDAKKIETAAIVPDRQLVPEPESTQSIGDGCSELSSSDGDSGSDAQIPSTAHLDVSSPPIMPTTEDTAIPKLGVRKHVEIYDEECIDYTLGNDPYDSEGERQAKRAKGSEPTGESRSTKYARAQREAEKQAGWVPDPTSFKKWKEQCRAVDKGAKFFTAPHPQIWYARCSACSQPIGPKGSADASRFADHFRKCKGSKRSTSQAKRAPEKKVKKMVASSIQSFFSKAAPSTSKAKERTQSSPSAPPVRLPCPGLTSHNDNRIPRYLERTSAAGGGARALYVIAREVFGKMFSKLEDEDEMQRVLDLQYHERKWVNDHKNLRVFSTLCEKEVNAISAVGAGGVSKQRNRPCLCCAAILSEKGFKDALRKKPEDPRKARHTPHRFRNTLLGQLCARHLGLDGIFKDVSL